MLPHFPQGKLEDVLFVEMKDIKKKYSSVKDLKS